LANALLDGEERLAEGLDRAWEALGDGLGRLVLGEAVGRLAVGVPVEGRAAALPPEGRAAAVPVAGRAAGLPVEAVGRAVVLGWVEGRAPLELQPRASAVLADAAAVGLPLVLTRFWSGCHF